MKSSGKNTKAQKKAKTVANPKEKVEEAPIDKLKSDLAVSQAEAPSIVLPNIKIIDNDDLYFAFMEAAVLDLFAKRQNNHSLQLMANLYDQYQRHKTNHGEQGVVYDFFSESHANKLNQTAVAVVTKEEEKKEKEEE